MSMRVSLDIDDVLAQFYPAMCVRSGRPSARLNIWDGNNAAKFIKTNMPRVERNSRFWLNLKTLSNPSDINFEFDYYLTSSPTSMKETRRDWLIMHGFPIKPIIVTNDKVAEMKRLGIRAHIDDNPFTLKSIHEAGLIAIQFIPPYMSVESEFNPIRHLSQVDNILNQIERYEN